MPAPGPNNLITDVAGILVGNAEDEGLRSGVTVVLPEAPVLAAVDSRGGGPGTRETDALAPSASVSHVHAITLAGGSAYGLDAASGAMAWLAAQGRGYAIAGQLVPIVPAAILFDLNNGGDTSWIGRLTDTLSPYHRLALTAIAAAGRTFALGNAGAGYGAVAGPLKGGLGSTSLVLDDGADDDAEDGAEDGTGNGITVGALAAVNSHGSPLIPGTKNFWAWALEHDGELGGQRVDLAADAIPLHDEVPRANLRENVRQNTCLAVVATDAKLTRSQALRVAIMAQDGFARAVRPSHAPLDGDTVFVLATGRRAAPADLPALGRIGSAAADCVARAVARGVYEARSIWGLSGYDAL